MNPDDDLVLADDALMQSIRDLSPALQRNVGGDPDDYVFSRPGWRSPALLVDQAAAALIVSFRQPRSIVSAVLAISESTHVDPHRVLGEAYPIVRRLIEAGVLVQAGSEAARMLTPSLPIGASIGTAEIRGAVQICSDTEVYQVSTVGGTLAALKIARPGAPTSVIAQLQHEAQILDQLAGSVSPALYDADLLDGRQYLTMAWCPGVDAAAAAAALRGAGDADGTMALRRLCVAIASAYARLHDAGVVHGDIHPNNVLVGDQQDITILDFGLARNLANPVASAPPRRGVSFYFEPEYAISHRAGGQAPPVTERGEQYALAALIYRLLTGAHYLDFRWDDELFRQISEQPPLAFVARGAAAWRAGEAVLARALHKDVVQRFDSIAEFAGNLAEAVAATSPSLQHNASRESAGLLEGVVGRLQADPVGIALAAPTASLHYGAAGIGYLFYRLAGLRADARLLAMADIWAERALRESLLPEGFHSPELDRTNDGPGPISLFHTGTGGGVVRALVSSAQGDQTSADAAVRAFCEQAITPYDNVDATLGQASVLMGCAHLFPVVSAGTVNAVTQLGHDLHRSIWAQLSTFGDIAGSDALRWLGVAHGWAGVLHASLSWLRVAGLPVEPFIVDRLDELARLAEPVGKGLRWPQQSGTPPVDRRPASGWCHGTAGYVMLWNLADAFRPGSYREYAERAAWHSWQAQARMGGALCCGSGGQAYAMLSMYRLTGEQVWLTRAAALAERAAGPERRSLRRNSLYAGDVGIALLAAECGQPDLARMPLFETEGC